MNATDQLELSLKSQPKIIVRYRRKESRARWWFHQMRVTVNHALDWNANPPPPPEQTFMTFTKR